MLETWQRLDPRRRIILVGAAVLTLVAVLSLAQVATRPGMALLYSGLDPAAAGEVVGALEQMNVKSEVRGNAVYVAEDQRDRVRLALARDGLPRQGQAGYELLDQLSGFSATTDMFNAAYWRAKEGELARTILATAGVRAARVHIATPSRRPFARAAAGASASVTVTMSGGVLTQTQATAIRYLVALAVAELSPNRVAVIDSRAGMILAPGTDSPAIDAASEAAKHEAKLKAEIEQLLTARVGRDKARVSVTVETDREAETVTEKLFQPDSRVVISTDTEEISDTSSGSAGSVTVASNLPDGDAGASDTRSSERSESRERTNYDYSEIQRQTVRQAGAIRRISVAVLVDGITTTRADGEPLWEARSAAELKMLRDLVVAAIGFDQARGDIVTVESMEFQPDATSGALVEASPWLGLLERNAMTLIQIGVLSLVVLVLALMVVRLTEVVESATCSDWRLWLALAAAVAAALVLPDAAAAQSVTLDLGDGASVTGRAVQLFLLITVLSLAPGIAIMVTCFPFMVIVLSLLRQGIGLQQAPPNMLIVTLALFLTWFVMEPVFAEAWANGLGPLMDGDITTEQAWERGVAPFRAFMESQASPEVIGDLAAAAPGRAEALVPGQPAPLSLLVPAFLLSELERAFEVGFIIFLPFLIIDLVVASILMSMGMMMVPPVVVSLPLKLAFFVIADGWSLLASALVRGYGQ